MTRESMIADISSNDAENTECWRDGLSQASFDAVGAADGLSLMDIAV